MKTREAPLYIRCYDLTRWLLFRVEQLPRAKRHAYGERMRSAAVTLLECVSAALAFPGLRAARLQDADEALLQLRLALRLAGDARALSEQQLVYAHIEVVAIGRMLGGWKKRLA